MYNAFIENDRITGIAPNTTKEGALNVEITEEQYNLALEKGINYFVYVDGEIVLNPDYETEEAAKERERIDNLSLTKREVLLALFDDKGIKPDQIKAQLDERGRIEFDYANEYFRGNPLINVLGNALGYTSEQLDYLFANKSFH